MRSWIFLLALLTACFALSAAAPATATEKNGFDLDGALIPADEVVSGGPPRDGIPALNDPELIGAGEARYLDDDDRVLGVALDGEARAYPVRILNWHEVVNDQIGTQHFAVSYCPLCGTGMVFAANVADTALIFGISGLLYNSDVLLFDRNTESLWSQILAKAVTGPFKGTELPQLPATHTTWGEWRKRHPDTLVLSTDTGFGRDYRRNPYAGYERSRRLYFDVANQAPRDYHPKALVLGVKVDGVHKAYPFEELESLDGPVLEDTVNGRALRIHYDAPSQTAEVTTAAGEPYPGTVGFWFAWYAFFPDTEVFTGDS